MTRLLNSNTLTMQSGFLSYVFSYSTNISKSNYAHFYISALQVIATTKITKNFRKTLFFCQNRNGALAYLLLQLPESVLKPWIK